MKGKRKKLAERYRFRIFSVKAMQSLRRALCLGVSCFAAMFVLQSVLPFAAAFAETGGVALPSYDAGLRRTALPSGFHPEPPAGLNPERPAFAGFGVDTDSQTPFFWAYVPERCSMGLFGKTSLGDGRWTYLGAFSAAESLTHCTISRSGDFHFFKMARIDIDEDGDGVPDSIARLCGNGDSNPVHGGGSGGESTTPHLPVSPTLSATPLPKGETAVLAETSKFLDFVGDRPRGIHSATDFIQGLSPVAWELSWGQSPIFPLVIVGDSPPHNLQKTPN